jgi:hypothetical protein
MIIVLYDSCTLILLDLSILYHFLMALLLIIMQVTLAVDALDFLMRNSSHLRLL